MKAAQNKRSSNCILKVLSGWWGMGCLGVDYISVQVEGACKSFIFFYIWLMLLSISTAVTIAMTVERAEAFVALTRVNSSC